MSNILYENFGFSTSFLSGYRKLKIPIIDDAGNSAWPEIFPINRIEYLRKSVGARHFSAQMMLEYVPPDRVRLDPQALHFYDYDFDARTAKLGDVQITGAVAYWDPSMANPKSDGSVCVLLYRNDCEHTVFLHDMLYLKVDDGELYPLTRQCETVLDFLAKHRMRRIIVETNGLGNALPEILRDTAKNRGDSIYIQSAVNTKNKETRILDAIESILTTGRMYAHSRINSTPFLAEMQAWAPMGGAQFDDGLDAVAAAIGAVPVPIRPIGTYAQTIRANTNFKV